MPTDPAVQLYDSACELLAAAQDLKVAAGRPEVGPAIPATLGCLGEVLAELARSSNALAEEMRRTRKVSDRHVTACLGALDRLMAALDAGREASETARGKAALAAGARASAASLCW